jgi:hypothetical protein
VEFGNNSAFVLGPRRTTDNLDRVDRSQVLPDAKSIYVAVCIFTETNEVQSVSGLMSFIVAWISIDAETYSLSH